MMRLTRSATPLPIGVDVGVNGIRMVQLAVVDEAPRIVGSARMRYSDEQRAMFPGGTQSVPIAAIKSELNQLAAQGQFAGREIVFSLPRELVQVKTVRLPTMPMDDLIQAAELDARTLFNVDERTATVKAIPAGEVRHGSEVRQEVVTLCVRNSDVDALVESWHATGFRPVGIDFEPAAIYRTVERFVRRRDDESEVNVLVDLSARRTTVVIGRGKELNFLKSFEVGGAMLTHAVARKLGISVSDAITLRSRLADTADQARVIGTEPVRQAVVDAIRPICDDAAREVGLCLRYYSVNFRGQRPSRVRLVGGEAADPTVVQLFANALPVPVETGKPLLNADCSQMKASDRTDAISEWTQAFGLALKFTKGSFADRSGASRASRSVPFERATEIPELSSSSSSSLSFENEPAKSVAPTAPDRRLEIPPEAELPVPAVASRPEVSRA